MKFRFTLLLVFLCFISYSQELFPLNDNASNIPKGVLAVRLFDESYPEKQSWDPSKAVIRNMFGPKLMYGLLPRLSIYAEASVSNHHSHDFPPNLAYHTHNGNQSTYHTGNYALGVQYPYIFGGIFLYAKYRFISDDGQNFHLRMAGYAEWSNINVAHDETEPNLLEDTKGYGAGIITTFLKKHIAISLTSGVVMPGIYKGYSPDIYGGTDVPTELYYGNCLDYHLSFGYLLLPKKYDNYNQTNINVYIEFIGEAYRAAKVTQYDGYKTLPIQTPLLEAGNYVDVYPGIQAIFKSNLRADLSVGFPMINKSYAHFYPVVQLGIQRYFFFNKKPS